MASCHDTPGCQIIHLAKCSFRAAPSFRKAYGYGGGNQDNSGRVLPLASPWSSFLGRVSADFLHTSASTPLPYKGASRRVLVHSSYIHIAATCILYLVDGRELDRTHRRFRAIGAVPLRKWRSLLLRRATGAVPLYHLLLLLNLRAKLLRQTP